MVYFWPNYQYPFWYSESLVFHYSTIISTKKLSLYIYIPNIYFGLGFEFGLQRIRNLACRVSIVYGVLPKGTGCKILKLWLDSRKQWWMQQEKKLQFSILTSHFPISDPSTSFGQPQWPWKWRYHQKCIHSFLKLDDS